MSKKLSWVIIVITVIVDVCIMVHFHNWCADSPRTTILWLHGAFEAYSKAYFLGLCTCAMCSIPAFLAVLDLTYGKK